MPGQMEGQTEGWKDGWKDGQILLQRTLPASTGGLTERPLYKNGSYQKSFVTGSLYPLNLTHIIPDGQTMVV